MEERPLLGYLKKRKFWSGIIYLSATKLEAVRGSLPAHWNIYLCIYSHYFFLDSIFVFIHFCTDQGNVLEFISHMAKDTILVPSKPNKTKNITTASVTTNLLDLSRFRTNLHVLSIDYRLALELEKNDQAFFIFVIQAKQIGYIYCLSWR